MKLADIQLLYNYNYWASAKILMAATNVTQEEFLAPVSFPNGSLRGILVHIVAAEWIWRMRIDEGTYPSSLLVPEDFSNFLVVLERFQEEEANMRGYLARLSDKAINESVTYRHTSGAEHTQVLWQILTHLVMHGMQHRAEAAAALTDLGHSPGDIDLIVYLREMAG